MYFFFGGGSKNTKTKSLKCEARPTELEFGSCHVKLDVWPDPDYIRILGSHLELVYSRGTCVAGGGGGGRSCRFSFSSPVRAPISCCFQTIK